jgi:hypothetical protein
LGQAGVEAALFAPVGGIARAPENLFDIFCRGGCQTNCYLACRSIH